MSKLRFSFSFLISKKVHFYIWYNNNHHFCKMEMNDDLIKNILLLLNDILFEYVQLIRHILLYEITQLIRRLIFIICIEKHVCTMNFL